MIYRVSSGYHGRWVDGESVTFGPGDKIELTADQAARLGDQVKPLGAVPTAKAVAEPPVSPELVAEPETVKPPEPEPEPEPEPAPGPRPDFGLAKLPMLEAIARVKSITHPDTLRALLEEERAGKNRKTVKAAIEGRLR